MPASAPSGPGSRERSAPAAARRSEEPASGRVGLSVTPLVVLTHPRKAHPARAAGPDSGLQVHRNMRGTERRERLSAPAAPAVLEPHPGEARHEVELGWPRVAHLDRAR